jgi:hypothetical protein
LKDEHKLDKMLFSILDSKLNDDFYLKKLRFNPSDKVPPIGFKWGMQKWIQSGTPEDNAVEAILLDIHYKYDRVENMVGLLDVINKESCTSFLMDDTTMNIVVVCTTHNTKDVPTIWKGLGWESFLLGLLNARAMFKVVCICDHKCRNPNLAKCGGEAQHLEKLGIGSPPGLPNVQSSTAGPKTPRIGAFLVSLERS